MQVAAIIVLGERASFADTPESDGFPTTGPDQLEWFAGSPIVALELLGQSALERMMARLQSVGAQAISLVAEEDQFQVKAGMPGCRTENVLLKQPGGIWPVIGSLVDEYATNGFDTILLIRVGAYVEFDFADFLQFHRDKGQAVTRASDRDGPLDFWMINGKHFREAGVFFHEEKCMVGKAGAEYYGGAAYVNRLLHARDIRRLVTDALEQRLSIRPPGKEIRPGVWIDDNARLHPRARVEGPAYIGVGARIEATTLVAGLSNVERHSHIDCGTAVGGASILAHTYLGAWLAVSQAVVCGNKVANLRHNVTVEILDERLIKHTSSFHRAHLTSPGVRDPADRLEPALEILKPQRSVFRAARALFLAKRTQ